MIKNIKISVEILVKENWRKKILSKEKKLDLNIKLCGNIVILKYMFTYCIIEKRKKSTPTTLERKFVVIHVNITGIKDFSKISQSILNLKNSFFRKKKTKILKVKIDNITSSFSFPKRIILPFIKKRNFNTKYNPERFPGLFLKFEEGTAIIFENGKVNIVGSKSKENVLETWRKVRKMIFACI